MIVIPNLSHMLAPKRGDVMRLAIALGVSQPTVSKWFKVGRVPAERVKAVSDETGVPTHVIRPDVFPAPKQEGV